MQEFKPSIFKKSTYLKSNKKRAEYKNKINQEINHQRRFSPYNKGILINNEKELRSIQDLLNWSIDNRMRNILYEKNHSIKSIRRLFTKLTHKKKIIYQ